jgi:hypothetical protein
MTPSRVRVVRRFTRQGGEDAVVAKAASRLPERCPRAGDYDSIIAVDIYASLKNL